MPLSSNQTPARPAKGRQPVREPISAIMARRTAERLLRDNQVKSPMLGVLQALSVAGVLTCAQLQYLTGISDRTLRKYYTPHWIDYPRPPVEHLGVMGWDEETPEPERRIHALGAVGHELVQQMGPPEQRYPSGADYAGRGAHRIMHDLAVSTTALGLRSAAIRAGLVHQWLSRYEATIKGKDESPLLEPDALLVLSQGGERVVFTIEHHDEDTGQGAAEKVECYERLAQQGYFRSWNSVGGAPIVLVTFLHDVVGSAYREAVQAWPNLRCRYLGRRFWAMRQQGDYASWMELPSMKRLDLFGRADPE